MLRAEALDQTRSTGTSSDQSSSTDFQQCVRDAEAKTARERNAQNSDDQSVTAKRGDTLWGIAKRDGVSLDKLLSANPQFDPAKADGVPHFDRSRYGQWDPDYIRPGDHIRLPASPRGPHRHGSQSPRAHGGAHHHKHAAGPHKHATGPHHSVTPKHTHPPPTHPTPTHPTPTHPTPTHPTPAQPPRATQTPPPATTQPSPPHGRTQTPPPGSSAGPTQSPVSPSGAPNHGPQTFVPIPIGKLLPSKGGFGIENGWKFSKTPTVGGEPYGKASWDLYKGAGSQLNLNLKLKYTPRAKATIGIFEPGGAQQVAKPKVPFKERVKGLLPEKITLDAGIVVNKQVESGGSVEWKFDPDPAAKKKVTISRSAYVSKKDPKNLLVDTAQMKVGKLKPKALAHAVAKGTRDSIRQPSADAKANGRWSPLRKEVWKSVNGAEVTVAGEKAFVNPHGELSGFANFAGKTTLKDIGTALEPPANVPSRSARMSGFATGTIVSFVGGQATDELVGKDIHNQSLRKAVDGFGAGMSGVVSDAVTQKVAPILASKVTATTAWTRVATPVLEKAGSLVTKAAAPVTKVLKA
ncbi:MAG: LysM peptidoglycan-binding domain-containing protein, partial [Acetobacteraceae bacterium]|nr:LysM peptidoglycan-binding domain-containing protein [Acetobacteraceae bacterium]